MNEQVTIGFDRTTVVLTLQSILPLKMVPEALKTSPKYKVIARSIAEVGIIEPLVVARSRDDDGRYVLLDGHLRHAVLVDAGVMEVRCVVASDDEAFTYNTSVDTQIRPLIDTAKPAIN